MARKWWFPESAKQPGIWLHGPYEISFSLCQKPMYYKPTFSCIFLRNLLIIVLWPVHYCTDCSCTVLTMSIVYLGMPSCTTHDALLQATLRAQIDKNITFGHSYALKRPILISNAFIGTLWPYRYVLSHTCIDFLLLCIGFCWLVIILYFYGVLWYPDMNMI